jgi:hypothetical protein
LFLLARCAASAAAPAAYLFAYLDKNKITIGDRVKLTIILKYSGDVKLEEFKPEDNLKSFEVKDYSRPRARREYIVFGRKVKKYEYLLSTFTTGIYEIKPFAIKFSSAGRPAECQTSPLKLEVASMLERESATDIRDIKPPVNIKRNPVFYLLLLGIPIIAAAGYYFYRTRFSKNGFAGMPDKEVDPYEYATSELAKLGTMALLDEGRVKEFYVSLSYVVRVYLTMIFSVNITDMTTTEAVRALRERDADKRLLIRLREFFECADLVKFAKYVPERPDTELHFKEAGEIVEAARPAASAAGAADEMQGKG